jgi:hypothetical protein
MQRDVNVDDKADVLHAEHEQQYEHQNEDQDIHKVGQKLTTASELQNVLLTEKPRPFTRNMINLYLILIPAYLCSTT